MSKALDELKGFVVFNVTTMSLNCVDILRSPQYVVAFFDYDNPRLMLVPGKAEDENVLRLTKQGNDYRIIKSLLFRAEIQKLSGKDLDSGWFLPGKKVDVIRPTIVFNLKDMIKRVPRRTLK